MVYSHREAAAQAREAIRLRSRYPKKMESPVTRAEVRAPAATTHSVLPTLPPDDGQVDPAAQALLQAEYAASLAAYTTELCGLLAQELGRATAHPAAAGSSRQGAHTSGPSSPPAPPPPPCSIIAGTQSERGDDYNFDDDDDDLSSLRSSHTG